MRPALPLQPPRRHGSFHLTSSWLKMSQTSGGEKKNPIKIDLVTVSRGQSIRTGLLVHVAARHHADSPFIEVAEDVPLVSGGIFSAEPRSVPVPARLAGGIGRCLPAFGGEVAGFWRGAALRHTSGTKCVKWQRREALAQVWGNTGINF